MGTFVVSYLYINAALYFFFAVWCLIKPDQTADFSGLKLMNGSGRSEYLTIYAGLQTGLAGFYIFAALKEEMHLPAILFSLFLYAGILLVRLTSLATLKGVKKGTYYIATMELLLGIGALTSYLYFP